VNLSPLQVSIFPRQPEHFALAHAGFETELVQVACPIFYLFYILWNFK